MTFSEHPQRESYNRDQTLHECPVIRVRLRTSYVSKTANIISDPFELIIS
ncbi:Uncharacterised protein [Mycobacterium tuberculosis]|nr:Uncharacterised protein [Mycobacterium tuberculosis]